MVLDSFHPELRNWFAERLGEPTEPQRRGWPVIRSGGHALIAAPTGSGKTLAAFFSAIDSLVQEGPNLPHETRVLYVSPLRALSNDIQKNLQGPLGEIRLRHPFFPDIRVAVRTGDTPASERAGMLRKPPHILVTTPESLYILLTSDGGRGVLRNCRTVIVDEIHALARDKRGSHLSLSLERLEALTGSFQRIGLSATQKPIEDIASFLVGTERDCTIVDAGHAREIDLAVEIPDSPLDAVCSNEVWGEVYEKMARQIEAHSTTLIFVNTRRLAERIAARLTERLGESAVTCHHGSLSRERRLDAEQRLKRGDLKALVATASLELGIDIGDVDLVIQVGACRSIATLLQRVGRAGHSLSRTPKGRIFPLTIDELVEAGAICRAIRNGDLDKTPQPTAPLDILAQQIVADCVPAIRDEDDLYARFTRAHPYRNLSRDDFNAAVRLHTKGRRALLHRDGVNNRLRATKRARITAVTCGGAIPDVADFQVIMDPEGVFVGTVDEDFAIESPAGSIFQLGNTSWRVLQVGEGVVRVADAQGQPPNVPFWLGEGPGRTEELSAEIGLIREECDDEDWLIREAGFEPEASRQVIDYLAEARRVLGVLPTQKRIVAERFFDEAGGMQLVLHAPFGTRINRAWGYALRKRFCRGFGFELQAAANDEAIVISLAKQHSFPLDDVFKFLHPNSCREVLIQAILDQPIFESRWRWNATRSLVLERMRMGKKVPPQILRMRAADLLTDAFPDAVACPENLPAGSLEVPMDHPLVRQTVEDCLFEAMDVDGYVKLIEGIRDGSIETVAVDTPEPSILARGILNAMPYAFLDDAPLEERRTRAVASRRTLDAKSADGIGALDKEAVERVQDEAWPKPENVEEVHEALLWMGYVTDDEALGWRRWLAELESAGRVRREDDRWYAVDGMAEPRDILRGRLEALGPVVMDDPLLLELEREGTVLRVRYDGQQAWCDRRLLARIHRYTLERLRRSIEPVSVGEFLQYLACWQYADPEFQLEGPRGVAEVIRRLAGFEMPASAWEKQILAARVRDYRREWLDELTLSGEVVWGRLWGAGASPIKSTPICFIPRDDLFDWIGLSAPSERGRLGGPANDILAVLERRGAMFPQELRKVAELVPAHLEMGLAELISFGLITCDSFAALRQFLIPPSKRRTQVKSVGRWSLFREREEEAPPIHFVIDQLLSRYGVIFKKMLAREKLPIAWSPMVRELRAMELRGEIRGGRFVAGVTGEQFALPEAIDLMRRIRRAGPRTPVTVPACDPLNLVGIITPDERIPSSTKQSVSLGPSAM